MIDVKANIFQLDRLKENLVENYLKISDFKQYYQ
jgi:hypothetical protein